MKNLLYVIIATFTINMGCKAQEESFSYRSNFANQGEQEDYWAEKLFYEQYKKNIYEKFEGEIIEIDDNNIKFKNKVLNGYFSNEYKLIFTSGLFYPQLLSGNEVTPRKNDEELSKMSNTELFRYQMTQNDTLSIGEFEELKFLNKTPTIKRFRFWEYRNWSNPQVYFIELTNENADKTTDLEKFIKGATLTFVKNGWVIL